MKIVTLPTAPTSCKHENAIRWKRGLAASQANADIRSITLNPNNRVIVSGSDATGVFTNGPNLAPAADNATSLGLSFLRWQQVWAVNGVIQTSDHTLKTDIKPLPAALPIVRSINPVSFKWIDGGFDLIEDTETHQVHATAINTYDVVDHEMRDGKTVQVRKTRTRQEYLYDNVPVHDADGNPVLFTVAARPAITDPAGQVVRAAQPAQSVQKTHRIPRMIEREVSVTRRVSRPGRRNHLGFLASDVKAGFDRHAAGMDYGVYVKGEDGTEHLRPDQMIPVLWKAVQEVSASVTVKDQKLTALEAEFSKMKAEITALIMAIRTSGDDRP